jgi:hypothetical protein
MALPMGWRDYETADERALAARWSMFGIDMIQKVGRKWDSMVPGAPLFSTKRAAHDFLSTFVCDAIPRRCLERIEQKAA